MNYYDNDNDNMSSLWLKGLDMLFTCMAEWSKGKYIYSQLFAWAVETLNETLKAGCKTDAALTSSYINV